MVNRRFLWFPRAWGGGLIFALFAMRLATGQDLQPDPVGGPSALRVAVVQVSPQHEVADNVQRATVLCEQAAEAGADIILFPEMFSVGYQTSIDFSDPGQVARWKAKARSANGPFIDHFQRLARRLDLAIAMTYLEDLEGTLRNATSVIDRHGELRLTYAKVHTCRFFPMEGALAPGDEFFVTPLDTNAGVVQVGVMTCYDREFPESARALMLKGAEVVLTPNACGLDDLRLKQFQIRAWENSLVTIMANYASGQGNGRSCAYAADGKQLLLADDQSGLEFVDVDLERLRQTRKRTFWGNAWRRPDVYEGLISEEIRPPFRRVDAFDHANSGPPQGPPGDQTEAESRDIDGSKSR